MQPHKSIDNLREYLELVRSNVNQKSTETINQSAIAHLLFVILVNLEQIRTEMSKNNEF